MGTHKDRALQRSMKHYLGESGDQKNITTLVLETVQIIMVLLANFV